MTSLRAQRVAIARAALALRESVLAWLSGPDLGGSRESLRAASPEAWTFFLRVECCALPLLARLRQDRLLDDIDDACRAQLLAAESRELQRVLAARLVIRELDGIGERAGIRFTLLKGGAIAADGTREPLDLGDVDVLVAPEHTARAWQALLANGWTPAAGGLGPADELGARPHYAPLRSERHQLPLELHAQADYGLSPAGVERARESMPILGYRCIDRLSGARAVAAALRHSVVVHPHRRGHLRDLFLLGQLLGELDGADLNRLERDLQGDARRVELLAMLEQSRALARGEPIAEPEVLRPFVRLKYAAAAGTTPLLGSSSPGWNTWSHVALERPPTRRAEYARLLRGATEHIDPDWSPLRHPGLDSGIARSLGLPRLVRVARRAGLVIALVAVGGMIRRHVAALNSPSKGVD